MPALCLCPVDASLVCAERGRAGRPPDGLHARARHAHGGPLLQQRQQVCGLEPDGRQSRLPHVVAGQRGGAGPHPRQRLCRGSHTNNRKGEGDHPPLQCCGAAVDGVLVSNSILITTPARTCPGAQRPVPGVMFFNATTALPDASSHGGFGTLQLDGPLLLCATVFSATVPLGTRPALDLTDRTTPLWNASATGQVMVLNLVRSSRSAVDMAAVQCAALLLQADLLCWRVCARGDVASVWTPRWGWSPATGRVRACPAAQMHAEQTTCTTECVPLQVIQAPAWPLPNATSMPSSALPLSALVSATTSASASPSQSQQRLGALIELTRTTLVVPVLDFLALVTLATESNASAVASVRACMDASVLSQAALLAPGIQVRVRSRHKHRPRVCIKAPHGHAPDVMWFTLLCTGHRPWQHHLLGQPDAGGLHGLGRQRQRTHRAAQDVPPCGPGAAVPLCRPSAAARCRHCQQR